MAFPVFISLTARSCTLLTTESPRSCPAADVAADVARPGGAATVVVATRRPAWYLPRYIDGRPADLVFYSRAATARSQDSSQEERDRTRQKFFSSIVGAYPSPLAPPDLNRGELPFVTVSDDFLNAVTSGSVAVRPHGVSGFDGPAAIFSDGHRAEFDAVVLATGFRLELPFLSDDARKTLELDSQDLLQPIILHECVWRPELPGLAFVGLYRGPYFAAMELQARWACGVFSGRLPKPSPADVAAGLASERSVRHQRPRPQFPHGDYVGMTEALAKRVGVHPESILAEAAHPLRGLLYDGPLLPFHYRLVGFGGRPADAEAATKECAARYPVAKL